MNLLPYWLVRICASQIKSSIQIQHPYYIRSDEISQDFRTSGCLIFSFLMRVIASGGWGGGSSPLI